LFQTCELEQVGGSKGEGERGRDRLSGKQLGLRRAAHARGCMRAGMDASVEGEKSATPNTHQEAGCCAQGRAHPAPTCAGLLKAVYICRRYSKFCANLPKYTGHSCGSHCTTLRMHSVPYSSCTTLRMRCCREFFPCADTGL